MLPICFAFISSFCGSLQNVMFKSVTQLASDTASFKTYDIYLFVFAAIILAVFQLSWFGFFYY